jgi:hypothetical protein
MTSARHSLLRRAALLLVPALALAAFVGGARRSAADIPPAIADPVVPTPMTPASIRTAAFGTDQLPRTRPSVERDVADPRFPYAARVDRLTVHMPRGFTSVAYDLRPPRSSGRTIVFHNGHAQDVDALPHVLDWFVSRGWRVITMAMPQAGENASPGFKRRRGHDQLIRLERPLRVFLEPVVAVLNYSHADTMVGFSGGGWTTVVSAAIDTRIRRSYSVAGSVPWRWRCLSDRPGCEADLEQRLIPDYLRLYELGSGPGRRQVALYNLDDPCCFGGDAYRIWAPRVRGNFAAVSDRASNRHAVTELHLRVITRDLETRLAP